MLEAYCRPLYQKWLVDPLAQTLAPSWSPAIITFVGAILGVLSAPCLWAGLPWCACLLLLSSGYLDTLDGTVARLRGQSSSKGSALDIICDRMVEFFVILGLYGIDPAARGWACLWMLGSILICVTTFLVV